MLSVERLHFVLIAAAITAAVMALAFGLGLLIGKLGKR